MAFNFPPPFPKRNTDNVVQKQLRNRHPASFSQPPPSNDSTQHRKNYNIPPPQAVPSPSCDSTQHRRNYSIPPPQVVPSPSSDSTQHRRNYNIPPLAVTSPSSDSTQHRKNYNIPPPLAVTSPISDSTQCGRNYNIPLQGVPSPSRDLTQHGRNYNIPSQGVPSPSTDSTQHGRNFNILPQGVPSPSSDSTQHGRNFNIPPQGVPSPSRDLTQHGRNYNIPPQGVPSPSRDLTQHGRNYNIPPEGVPSPSRDLTQHGRTYNILPQGVPSPSRDSIQHGRNYNIPPQRVPSPSTDSTQHGRTYNILPQGVPSSSRDSIQHGRNYNIPPQRVPSPSTDSTQHGRNYNIPPQGVPSPSTDSTQHGRNYNIPPQGVLSPSTDSTQHGRNYNIPPQGVPSPSTDSTQHTKNYNILPPVPVPSPAHQQSLPRWQQSNEMPMSLNPALPASTRSSLEHYNQENHPAITSSSQQGNCYPFPGNAKIIPSDQADKSVALPDDPLRCKAWDETWLENWLSRRRTNTTVPPTEKEASKALKVYQAREALKKCCSLIQNLENSHQELLDHKDKLTNQVWRDKWRHINEIQKQIADALTTVSVGDNMNYIKKALAKRKKKRLAQKRRKELYKINQKKNLLKRQELHENINAWLKNMEEVVEKAKREESLKHEADLVLGEVTRKKTEARRQLSLLSVLLKLRQIRAQSSANRGQPVSAESSARFIKVIEHLQKLWEDQLRDYNVEEQGLRVMLEEAVEERTQSYDKQAVAEWDRVLFGTKSYVKFRNFYLAAENSTQAFVAIRKCWDKYLAPSDAVMSSAIPVGWVLPTNPSSSAWEKHLKPHY